MQKLFILVMWFCIGWLFVLSCELERKSEEDLDRIYCKQVDDSFWPDYRHLYDALCK